MIEEGGHELGCVYDVEAHENGHGGSSGSDRNALVSMSLDAQVDLFPALCVLDITCTCAHTQNVIGHAIRLLLRVVW
jgi:hypothetical protein